MDKADPPQAFGVFKPVGHIVIAFRTSGDMQSAARRLLEQGFATSALLRYTPQQMTAQVDLERQSASSLASVGQELNLVKAHRALAERGYSFLVVHAPGDEQAGRVAAVARSFNAASVQRYGRFAIEELIDSKAGDTQVFESPDRGLDR